MTAALLRWWTVLRLNSHSNPSSTVESSTAKKFACRVESYIFESSFDHHDKLREAFERARSYSYVTDGSSERLLENQIKISIKQLSC